MRRPLALLLATTALSAAVGLPAWSALRATASAEAGLPDALRDGRASLPILLASDDDDDGRRYRRAGHDEDDDDDDDDGCEDDDGACRGGMNPAPAGRVSPPRSGLFGTGAAPQVRVN